MASEQKREKTESGNVQRAKHRRRSKPAIATQQKREQSRLNRSRVFFCDVIIKDCANMQEEKIETARPERHVSTWQSCCLVMDKGAPAFFAQLFVSLLVLTFCMYQLVFQSSCEAQALYSGVMTLVIGTWLPQPQIASNNKSC